MSQAIRPRVGKEFEGESKCCVSLVIVCDCVLVLFVLVIVCLLVCLVVAVRITPGAPRRLSPDQDGGLMLRGTSGVPGHQAQSGKGVQG